MEVNKGGQAEGKGTKANVHNYLAVNRTVSFTGHAIGEPTSRTYIGSIKKITQKMVRSQDPKSSMPHSYDQCPVDKDQLGENVFIHTHVIIVATICGRIKARSLQNLVVAVNLRYGCVSCTTRLIKGLENRILTAQKSLSDGKMVGKTIGCTII
ncbi:hypothetical protein COOONC_04866 [Cooperia oncophora]